MSVKINIDDYIVKKEKNIKLKDISSKYNGEISKEEGQKRLNELIIKLNNLQEVLYADSSKSILLIFQAMDAGGKDSTIRHVFGPLNPQGCRVISFKAPTSVELTHDFLWRVHKNLPPKGMIGIFNRSHYEDVLIVRVKNLAPKKTIEKRYNHINNFERMIFDEGVYIIKFYLHISKEYQKKRFERRLARADKHWKFNPDDLKERDRWDDYKDAFEKVFSMCSKANAPWYIVPAETRWFRDLLVAEVVYKKLKSMNLKYPEPLFNPKDIIID